MISATQPFFSEYAIRDPPSKNTTTTKEAEQLEVRLPRRKKSGEGAENQVWPQESISAIHSPFVMRYHCLL